MTNQPKRWDLMDDCYSILTSFEDIVLELDMNHYLLNIWMNNQILPFFQRENNEGKRIDQILTPALAQLYSEKISLAKTTKVIELFDHPSDLDGDERWFAARIKIIRHSFGTERIIIAIRDITRRKKNEERYRILSETLERYSLLAEHSRDIILFVRPDGRIIEANRAAELAYGYTRKELRTLSIHNLRAEDSSIVNEQLQRAINHGILFETFHRRKDGSVFPIEASSRGEVLEDGPVILSVIRDISERRKMEETLAASDRNFMLMADSIDEVFTLINATGEVLYVNPAFDKIWGIERKLLYEDPKVFFHSIHPEDQNQVMNAFNNDPYLTFGTMDEQFKIVRPDGTIRSIWAKSNPVNEDASLRVIVANDISEMKNIENSLRKAKEMAENASQAKSQFLANMSHEIRTPMNGIIGMLELALANEIKDHFIEIARNSAKSLVTILNDILDYSRIDAGKLMIVKKEFNLTSLLSEVKELFSLSANQKGLTLSFEVEPSVPEVIVGDSVRIRQIISNIVGNAVKFTSKGNIVISVSQIEQQTKNILHFIVTDTGIGIPKERINSIFESFTQVDGSYTKEYSGTGLGLTICKEILHLMDGDIWVQSDIGKGSKFHFTIPYTTSYTKFNPTEANQLESVSVLSNKRVLVVEDDHVSRILLQSILSKKGCELAFAQCGKEAIEKYREQEFDLILMDVSMPLMDGFQAAGFIRKVEEVGKHTPIIAITAHAFEEIQKRCLESGMDDYLTKPIQIQELLQKMTYHLMRGAQS